jgi:hypothetical protein
MLVKPQFAGRRMDVKPHRIAMAITPDLGARGGLTGFLDADEGVVLRHTWIRAARW